MRKSACETRASQAVFRVKVIDIKMPNEIKRYCPHCRTHKAHAVKQQKTAGRGKAGFKWRDRRIRLKIEKGYGGFPKKKTEHGVKYGAKTSKKVMLKYTCRECGKSHQSTSPKRSKKFELEKQ